VKEGECLCQWLLDGRQKVVVGPRRKYLWRSNIRFLDRHQADQRQYLVVRHRDGRREHVRGPIAMFEDPVRHQQIEVKSVISVDGFEALVVYKEDVEPKGNVERRIVRGPTQFMPDANEWVHEFAWYGADANGNKIENKFTKLRTIPDQINYSTEVRTCDDVLLTLKLIVFYEMADIERMLDSTSDPIGDMVNALSADLITFAAKVSYEKFLEVSAISLNDVSTFPLLAQRANSIGFAVDKVVYRGYKSSNDMQAMHESSIRTQQQMKSNHENTIKKQELEDLNVSRAAHRAEKEREIAAAEHTEKMRQKAVEHEAVLRQRQSEIELEESAARKRDEDRLSFLERLKALGVNLTQFLISEQSGKVDKVVRVETVPGAAGTTLLIDTK